ncbi:glycosyltransferase family 87 protein [Mucilaginibacter terrenus]|nr:glycosyltransferase family 87 protein [Mucilaginibacter terrenus]
MAANGTRNVFYKLIDNKHFVLSIWIIIAAFYTYKCIGYHGVNNYLIFKYTYFNALHGQNLYAQYPQYYFDSNHYGPVFSLIMAPFAVLPGDLGLYFWQIFNVSVLFWAIHKLPLDTTKKNIICIICTQELIVMLREFQTNGAIAALVILAWVMVDNKKDFWAGLFIMLGFFIKLYGVIGVVFFLISKQKKQFVAGLFVWAVVLFVLPMLVFTPQFILQSYGDWYHSLVEKNAQNVSMDTQYQDISVMGMTRRIIGHSIAILPVLLTAAATFCISSLKVLNTSVHRQKFLLLCSSLLFIVLFSTGSEYVTYIIAYPGIAIWFVTAPRPFTALQITLFVFAVYFGSLYRTDIFPSYIKLHFINRYALKALPCLLIWLALIAEMLTRKDGEEIVSDYPTQPNIAPTLKN